MISRMNQVQKAPIINFVSSVTIPDNVISFGQGIPFFKPPVEAINAVKESLFQPNSYQYSVDNGNERLRKCIVNKIKKEQNVSISFQNEVIVTSGANQAFMNALLSITSLGDEIIFFVPTYFNYVMATKIAGCKPVFVQTTESYQPNLDDLKTKISNKTKAVVTISPNNPTGAVYTPELMKAINQLCQDHSIYHISDEVYEYFVYENALHVSPLCFDESVSHTISIFSLSKAFALSGYRIGYMVFPNHLYDDLLKVQDTIGICAPSPAQAAAEEAIPLGNSYCNRFIDILNGNRKVLQLVLNEIPTVHAVRTNGSYYLFITVDSCYSSFDLAKKLVENYGVIVLPGSMFDCKKTSLRISYGNLSQKNLSKGAERLKKGLLELQ